MFIETNPKDHFSSNSKKVVSIHCMTKKQFSKKNQSLTERDIHWAKVNGFSGSSGQHCIIPNDKGGIACVLFGLGSGVGTGKSMAHGKLARLLPKGNYKLEGDATSPELAELAWALGGYSYDRYRKRKHETPKLVVKTNSGAKRLAEGSFIARDLINTPANDMGPDALEKAFRKVGKTHAAKVSVIKGESLLKKGFPMVHAVGRASAEAPRVLDMKWGKANHPKVTLVGKGVTFDTGGLNIKPGGSMALMKKDMGGAANVLGLAHMIMDAKLPVRLRVIIGAVENSISSNAFRPGDILDSRKGLSVEIGNTDAEGRLVLGDCLTWGDEEKPDVMIDMATLTGAARVALGPDLPPFYTDDDGFADLLGTTSMAVNDPLWRLPLWDPYQSMLGSKIADVNHITAGGFAGSITAALFLSRFVENAKTWVHFDIFGWTPSEKPWAPVGGEAQGIRSLFEVFQQRYKK